MSPRAASLIWTLVLPACTASQGEPQSRASTRSPAQEAATPPQEAAVADPSTPGPSSATDAGLEAAQGEPAACTTDAQCRTYDDTCDGCTCRVLRTDEAPAKCTGTEVACFVAPCREQRAACQDGRCTLIDERGGSLM